MIPSRIGVFRYDKHFPRAEFNAKPTAFASFFDDMDNAVGDPNTVLIQRLPPIFHDSS
jgi:hypothetical protein